MLLRGIPATATDRHHNMKRNRAHRVTTLQSGKQFRLYQTKFQTTHRTNINTNSATQNGMLNIGYPTEIARMKEVKTV